MIASDSLPDYIRALKAALLASTARALELEAGLAIARARTADDQAMISSEFANRHAIANR